MIKTAPIGPAIYPGETAGSMTPASRAWPVLAAGLFWLAAGLSAGYWVLLAWGRAPVVPVAAAPLAASEPDTALIARALGAQAAAPQAGQAPPPPSTRYTLLGVVAGASRQGAALIAVDDKPARPYRVGTALEGGLVLQSVGKGTARLGQARTGPATLELAVPVLAEQPS